MSDTPTPQEAPESGLLQPRLVRLAWSAPAPPCEECRYDHTRAETPFGTFLLTWKGWKEYDSPGFDETPWGEVVYNGWNTVEEAQAWAESEMERRIKQCLANEQPDPQEVPRPECIGWQDNPSCDPQILAVVPRVKILPGQTGHLQSKILLLSSDVKPCEWVSKKSLPSPSQPNVENQK